MYVNTELGSSENDITFVRKLFRLGKFDDKP